MDEVAENSDELMERYLDGEEIDHDEIVRALKQGVTAGRIFPVTCGVATRNLGTGRLLEALVEDLPSPAMRGAVAASRRRTARRSRSSPTRTGRWSPTSSRPSPTPTPAGSTSSASTAARLRSDSHAVNVTRGQKERIGQLGQPLGKELRPAPELGAGDIGAVAKLKETRAGDVLCAGPEEIGFAPLDLPDPVMAFAYEPKSKGDEEKAAAAVRRLTEEDPTLDVHRDAQTGEQIIAGLTQVHVEVIVARMKRRFGVEIELHPPRVPYQESIRQPGQRPRPLQEAVRAAAASSPIARSRSSRAEDGVGLEFVNKIKGAAIPGGFIPAVEKGVEEAMAHGTVAGYPVKGVRVRLVDGKHHDVDSSEMAFKIAGAMAFKEAMEAADPVLLEPIVRLVVSCPERRRRRRDRRPQLAPRSPAGDGAEGRGDRGAGRGADGGGARLRARPALDQRRPRRFRGRVRSLRGGARAPR